jgi:hypothetical protein
VWIRFSGLDFDFYTTDVVHATSKFGHHKFFQSQRSPKKQHHRRMAAQKFGKFGRLRNAPLLSDAPFFPPCVLNVLLMCTQ